MKKKILFILIILLAFSLRIFALDRIPPALYTDEVDQGYNAYSILLTGRDEHGAFLPISLRSFGDWKPPLPTYLMIPFIAVFGLNEISVRLPSALLGLGTIILSFYLVIELFQRSPSRSHFGMHHTVRPFATPGRWQNGLSCKELLPGGYSEIKLALLTSFFLAISPWHILQSRSAMLVVISLFFLEAGIYFFIKGIRKTHNGFHLSLSAIFFALSIYSYYGMRVITPLIVIYLLLYYKEGLVRSMKELIVSGIIGLILLLPLSFAFFQTPDVVFGRARTVSIFYDQGVKLRQWELITQDGINANPLLSRFFHNNLYIYSRSILQRFLSHFDGRFLLLAGDQTPPFQIPGMGILYLVDGIFILIGILVLYRKKFPFRNLVAFWLFASIIPASFTFMTPSSNRTFTAVTPFMIVNSIGILYLITKVLHFRYQHSPSRSSLQDKPFGHLEGVTKGRTVWCIPKRLLPGDGWLCCKSLRLVTAKCKTLVIRLILKKVIGISIITSVYALSFGFFLYQYFTILPKDHADWWNYGWKEIVEYVKEKSEDYENVVVSDIGGMPYINFLFYGKYNPDHYQKEAIRTYVADRFGFEHVEGFGKYSFIDNFDWEIAKQNPLNKTIYVIPYSQTKTEEGQIKSISDPSGSILFKIIAYE